MKTSLFFILIVVIISCEGACGQTSDNLADKECNLIDFETIPGETHREGLVISTQFLDSHGVSFSLEGGGFPRLASVGGRRTAFGGAYGGDTPAPGQRIGAFFLTDDGVLASLQAPPLIVTFRSPVSASSGVILDIDFDEIFTIEARDASDQVIERITIKSGDSNTGDAKATPWSFERDADDIYSIRFEGRRTAHGYFGLGFDNFYPCFTRRCELLEQYRDQSQTAQKWREKARQSLMPRVPWRTQNQPITCAYANIYKSNPGKFKWAGLAAIVSGKVGNECYGTAGGYCESILEGNRTVFDDLYWQHLAFLDGGIEEIEKIYKEGGLCEDTWKAWKIIVDGNSWQGNLDLLHHEQKYVLQPIMYDGPAQRVKWWLADTKLAEYVNGRILVSPIPGRDTSFPGNNIANFEERWNWIENVIWPEWREYESNIENQEKLMNELRKACPSCCE